MNVLKESKELTKQELYFLTKAQNIQKMSLLKGQRVDLESWLIYEDTNMDGEDQIIFSCMTPEHEVYATNSASFIRAFYDILDCFDPADIHSVDIISRTSKNNREFLTCVYAA